MCIGSFFRLKTGVKKVRSPNLVRKPWLTGTQRASAVVLYTVIDEDHLWLVITCRYYGRSLEHVRSGSGQIWLDNVSCRGTETNITSCPHDDWGSHNCGHSDDVSVNCTGPPNTGMVTSRCGLKQ